MTTFGPGWQMMDSFGLWLTQINETFRISFFLTGGLNGRVRFDLVFSFFSSFMYPDLWKFDKNEKFNPIQCQPGPKVIMTFYQCPGFIILLGYFYAYFFHFQDGLLDRSWVAGVLSFEVMLSHILTQFLVLIGQTSITLVFMFLVFKIPCHGPIGLIILITILQGFTGMCLGK